MNTIATCWCWYCLDAPDHGFLNPTACRMILCPDCGNKRCPKATHHDHTCSGSNEPGQHGSTYGDYDVEKARAGCTCTPDASSWSEICQSCKGYP